jgi:DNA-binding beta-propeller fold protein YncE
MVTQLVAGRTYDYSHSIGRGAPSGEGFTVAIDVAVGEGDRIYVLNRGYEFVPTAPWNRTARGARVGIFTVGTEPGDEVFIAEFGKYGDGRGEFIWPAGIALDSQSNVYVTDEWLHHVSVFDKEGNLLDIWGSDGDGDGEFSGPSGIACDSQNDLYVVDSRNHRVQKLSKDGKFLMSWGKLGTGEGEFDSPWGITLDGEGNVYVADHKNNRVQKFTADGQFLAQFGSYGTGRGELNRPSSVTVDPDGDVYICDWANDRVQVFSADGKYLTSFAGDAQELTKWAETVVGTNPGAVKRRREVKNMDIEWRLSMPTGVRFDTAKNRLLIVDTQRNRLQMYNKLREYAEPQRNL